MVIRIFQDYISSRAMSFLDDVKMKGLLSKYENKKVMLRVQRFVLKHLQNLSKVIADIKRVKCTIDPKL